MPEPGNRSSNFHRTCLIGRVLRGVDSVPYIVSFNGGATSKDTAKGAVPKCPPIGARQAESFSQTGLHFGVL